MEITKRVSQKDCPYRSEMFDLHESSTGQWGLTVIPNKEAQPAYIKANNQLYGIANTPGSAGNGYSLSIPTPSGANLPLTVDYDPTAKTIVVNLPTDENGNFNFSGNAVSAVVAAINAAITDTAVTFSGLGDQTAFVQPFGQTNFSFGNDVGVPVQGAGVKFMVSDSPDTDSDNNPGFQAVATGGLRNKVINPSDNNSVKTPYLWGWILVDQIQTDGSIGSVDIIVTVN